MIEDYMPGDNGDVYQAGGSLTEESQTYVFRNADEEIYQNLKKGNFCYILTARQMGKSSLRVRTTKRLKQEDYKCVSVDISQIGTDKNTVEQWYHTLMFTIAKILGVKRSLFREWWSSVSSLTPVSRLKIFFEDIIFPQVKENIVVFMDEIDSMLNLDKEIFSRDDFFAIIRSFYNERADNPNYQRLNFVIIGVAAPNDLISDKERTPFNIGLPIHLTNFTLDEAEALLIGFAGIKTDKKKLLKAILNWTGGQPVLTQMLCKQIAENETIIENPAQTLRKHVHKLFLSKDLLGDENNNLIHIHNRMISSEQHSVKMLSIYQEIVNKKTIKINKEDSTHIQLMLTGIVINSRGNFKIANRIYEKKFTSKWVVEELEKIDRPYAADISRWLEMGKAESTALKGEVLKKAYKWAASRNDLTETEREFIDFLRRMERKRNRRIWALFLVIGVPLLLFSLYKNFQYNEEVQKAIEFAAEVQAKTKEVELKNKKLNEINKEREEALKLTEIEKKKAKEKEQKAIMAKKKEQYHKKIAEKEKQKAEAAAENANRVKTALELVSKALQIADTDPTRSIGMIYQSKKYDLNDINQNASNKVYAENFFYKTLFNKEIEIEESCFSKDGKYIISKTLEHVFIYNIKTKQYKALKMNIGANCRIVILPEREEIFTYSQDTVKFWTLSGNVKRQFYWHQVSFMNAYFSSDGKNIYTSLAGEGVTIWNENGKKISTIPEKDGYILSVAISPDNRFILTGNDGNTAHLWNKKGELLRTFEEHRSWVNDVAFSPDGNYILTGSEDKTAILWTIDGTPIIHLDKIMYGIRKVGFSPDGNYIVTCSYDKELKMWDYSGNEVLSLKGSDDVINFFCFSPDGKSIVSTSEARVSKLWLLQGREYNNYRGHERKVECVSFSPFMKYFASGSSDKTIVLWKIDGEKRLTYRGHTASVNSIDFSPDGKTLISGSSDKTLKIWNLQGKILASVVAHKKDITCVRFSPDGKKIASASIDGTVKIWGKNGELIAKIKNKNRAPVWAVGFSPDGKKIVIGSDDKTVKIKDLNGKTLYSSEAHKGCVRSVCFSPDGTQILSGADDKTAILWNFYDDITTKFENHKGAVRSAVFSSDGKKILIGTTGNTAKLWDTNSKLIHVYSGHHASVNSVDFSPDGQFVLTGSNDKSIRLWLNKLPFESLRSKNLIDMYEQKIKEKIDGKNKIYRNLHSTLR